jgi:hypothetical protein
MDEDRRVRFFVSPMFFLASILWGFYRHDLLPDLSKAQPSGNWVASIVGIVLGASIAVFALGFLIGTVTYILLRLLALAFYARGKGSGCHEVAVGGRTIDRIIDILGAKTICKRNQQLFIAVTFDHETLSKNSKGIHKWLMRRWNAFSIGSTSVVGLLLSLLIGRIAVRTNLRSEWIWPALAMCVFFGVSAFFAWRDTMRMIEFQADRHWPSRQED